MYHSDILLSRSTNILVVSRVWIKASVECPKCECKWENAIDDIHQIAINSHDLATFSQEILEITTRKFDLPSSFLWPRSAVRCSAHAARHSLFLLSSHLLYKVLSARRWHPPHLSHHKKNNLCRIWKAGEGL